jgi:hypothetical protein
MITGSQAWFHLRLQNQCSFSYIWIISFTAFQFNQMRVVDFQDSAVIWPLLHHGRASQNVVHGVIACLPVQYD